MDTFIVCCRLKIVPGRGQYDNCTKRCLLNVLCCLMDSLVRGVRHLQTVFSVVSRMFTYSALKWLEAGEYENKYIVGFT